MIEKGLGASEKMRSVLPPYKKTKRLPIRDYWTEINPNYRIPHYFTEEQQDFLDNSANYRTAFGEGCPVCLGEKSYHYYGEMYECPDDSYGHAVGRLSALYFLSNIPLQYQQLVWDEWPTKPRYVEAKAESKEYISIFSRYRLNGVGLTLYSKMTGTGKTWGATAILKELVKKGYGGWFADFKEIKNYYEQDNATFLLRRVQEVPILVLDDVLKPWSERMAAFYADKLEELIRPRTNANLPTIITTNLTPEEMEEYYPRVFSLMSAKNISIELNGADARVGETIWKRNAETAANGEALPIN